jgi:hypothetical protein
MRVLVIDSAGATPLDVLVPGAAYDPVSKVGWTVNGKGTAWTYKNAGDPTPLIGGIKKIQLKAIPSTPGSYKFSVTGKYGIYPVDLTKLPLSGILVIDPPFATTGQCGEAVFPAAPGTSPGCAASGDGKTVKCK